MLSSLFCQLLVARQRCHGLLAAHLTTIQPHCKVQPVVVVLGELQCLLGPLELGFEVVDLHPVPLRIPFHFLSVCRKHLQFLDSFGRLLGCAA